MIEAKLPERRQLEKRLTRLKGITSGDSLRKYFESVIIPDHEFPSQTGLKQKTISLHTLKKEPFNELMARYKLKSAVLTRFHVGKTAGQPEVYMMTVMLDESKARNAFSEAALKKAGIIPKEVQTIYNAGGNARLHTVFTERAETAVKLLYYLRQKFPAKRFA
ncbi:MAG: hypothetical protein V1817_04465 [Candidatus Micrarchaeota archaeon]